MICLVILSLVAVAFARPDVSHLTAGYNYQHPAPAPSSGYEYNPPGTSYGIPIRPVDHNSGASSSQHYQHKPTGSYLPANQQLPNLDTHIDFSNNYQSGSSAHHNLDGLYNPTLIQDQKHVYYFAARDLEEEAPRLRINVIPNHQKNTNVIFVKAPAAPAAIPEIHAPPSTIEDKTKVVVLVKKPEHQPPINVHAPPATKHGKPEVFVVKYKDQHEAEHVVASGNGGFPLGVPVDQVRSEHHFVETLKDNNNDKYHNLGNLGVSGSSQSAGLYGSNGASSGSGSLGIRLSSDDGSSSFGSSSSSLAGSSKDSHGSHVSETYNLGDSFLDSKSGGASVNSGSSGTSFEISSGSGLGGASIKTHGSGAGRGLKITIENDSNKDDEKISSGSALSDAVVGSQNFEDDSLFSKYGPPGASGPY